MSSDLGQYIILMPGAGRGGEEATWAVLKVSGPVSCLLEMSNYILQHPTRQESNCCWKGRGAETGDGSAMQKVGCVVLGMNILLCPVNVLAKLLKAVIGNGEGFKCNDL